MNTLPSWEAGVQALVGPTLKIFAFGFTFTAVRKCMVNLSRAFSDEDVKPLVSRIPYQIGKTLLGISAHPSEEHNKSNRQSLRSRTQFANVFAFYAFVVSVRCGPDVFDDLKNRNYHRY